MSSFIFVRHGKSQANQDKAIAAPDSPLTKEGQAQARKVGRELKKEGVTRVVTSPYIRARETAEIIAKQLKITDVEVLDDLRERGLGQFENRPREHEAEWYYTVEGEADVEPRGMLIARCEAALAKIKKMTETDKVLVVGHTTSGFYLKQVASGKRFFEDFDPPKQIANASRTTIEIAEKRPMQRTSKEALVGLVAFIVGLLCLAGAIWLMNQRQTQDELQPTSVKQQQIPLSPEDYQGDPNLQGAVQKQLQQQSGSDQSSNTTSNVLQPVTTGIPDQFAQ